MSVVLVLVVLREKAKATVAAVAVRGCDGRRDTHQAPGRGKNVTPLGLLTP